MMRRSIAISVFLILTLSACASAARETVAGFPAEQLAQSRVAEPMAVEGGAAFDESMAAGAREAESANVDFAAEVAPVERVVIQTANLSLVVSEPAESVKQISQMAVQMGGFVVSSNVFKTTFSDVGVRADQASITIRVPAERLNEALERIKEGATEIQNESVSGQDVTQEYTDLQSRLRNLEAMEEELLEIMSTQGKTEDVLQVFELLQQTRQDIEITKGRIQYISEAAALSAISVDLIPDAAAQPLEIGGWRPEGTAREAFAALLRALRFLGNAAIWGGICVLPIGLLFGVPGYFVGRTILRRRRAAKAKSASE